MKNKKSVLVSLVLSFVTVLVLIGLTGCTIIIGDLPTPLPAQPPSEQPPAEQPPGEVQITFTADRTNLQPGECTTLQWNVQGGFWVELNGQPVEKSGQREVCPQETTPYWLGVDTGETVAQREVIIVVEGAEQPPPEEPPPPEERPPEEQPPEGVEVINLIVEPDAIPSGGCAILHWEVVPPGEWAVLLDGQEVPHVGEREVCPTNTTTYELLVEAPGGSQVRGVTLHVEGEPEPPPPEPTPPQPQPQPQPTSGCAGPPVISSFTANPSTITAGQSSKLEWGSVTNGTTGPLVRSVVLDPGFGEVGSPGSRVVKPAKTTTYTLKGTGCGGTTTKQVTVVVNPASVPLTPIILPGADLAVTDLYPDKLKDGKVYGRITNHGPDKVTNLGMTFSCSWTKTAYGATFGVNESVGPKNITIVSLNPGQTTPFNTGITVDVTQFWYKMTCSIQVPFDNLNTNKSNDSYTETISK
jgi:hypothetical protein